MFSALLVGGGGATLGDSGFLPESLDSLRTLAGLQRLQEQQPRAPPPLATATSASSGGGTLSASVNAAGNLEQLAAKAGAVAATASALPDRCAQAPIRDQAVVTLLTNNEGYPAGALAVAAALEVLDSQLRRIALVTEDVAPGIQDLLRSASWEVTKVNAIHCNQVMGPDMTPDRYDLGNEYQQKKAKWLLTCSKFHVRSCPGRRSVCVGRLGVSGAVGVEFDLSQESDLP